MEGYIGKETSTVRERLYNVLSAMTKIEDDLYKVEELLFVPDKNETSIQKNNPMEASFKE